MRARRKTASSRRTSRRAVAARRSGAAQVEARVRSVAMMRSSRGAAAAMRAALRAVAPAAVAPPVSVAEDDADALDDHGVAEQVVDQVEDGGALLVDVVGVGVAGPGQDGALVADGASSGRPGRR